MKTSRFRYTTSLVRSRDLLVMIFSPLLVLGAVVFWFVGPEAELFAELWSEISKDIGAYGLILAVGAALMVVLWAGAVRTRVTLSSSHLALNISPLTGLGLMGCTTGDHRIPAESISKIRLVAAKGASNLAQALQQARLEIFTDRQTFVLPPYNFLQVDGIDHRLGIGAFMNRDKQWVGTRAQQYLLEAPLVRALEHLHSGPGEIAWADTHAAGEEKEGSHAQRYNLLKHRGMVVQLVLLLVIGGYGFLDFLLLMEHQVLGHLPQLPFVLSGALAAIVGFHLGKDAPGTERAGVGVILVVAAVLAVQPGLKRYALQVSPRAEVVSYLAVETGRFQHPDYPAIDMRDGNLMEYWSSLPLGSGYDFHVHVTDLGYHLLDLRPVHEKTRIFYARRS